VPVRLLGAACALVQGTYHPVPDRSVHASHRAHRRRLPLRVAE
jgi:hypothetical protein